MAAVVPTEEFPDPQAENLRRPPHSALAEQAVIGGLLIDNDAWEKVAGIVGENDFYSRENRLLFREIKALAEEGKPFDIVTLGNRLQKNANDPINPLAYLGSLARETPSAANIVAYAQIVHEKSVRRSLIGAAGKIIEEAYKQDSEQRVLLDRAEQSIFEIADSTAKNDRTKPVSAHELSVDTYKYIDRLHKSGPTGVKTGFDDIDKKTSGLEAGELVVIAGRPSMGKTSLALNIVQNIVFGTKPHLPAVIFSMEMSARQIAMRFFSSLGHISQFRVRTGKLSDEDWTLLSHAMRLLKDAPIFIDDTSSLSPFDIHAKVRRVKREHGPLGVVMVDYLQLMQISGSKENRTAEISQISRAMKTLAREMEVPVLALSQLNRAVESRPDKRPMMSDLRESGAIEQDADLIMMIYREDVYEKRSEGGGGAPSRTSNESIAEINIAKQRNGPLFTAKLNFVKNLMTFRNYVSDEEYRERQHPHQGVPEADQVI